MYLPRSLSSLFKYSLSINDSILVLIIPGYGKKIVICLMTSCINSLCLNVFLLFMILTTTASIIFYLSSLISLSSTFSPSVFSAVCFLWLFYGMKLTLMLLFEKDMLTLTFSSGANCGFLRLSLLRSLVLGLQRKTRA